MKHKLKIFIMTGMWFIMILTFNTEGEELTNLALNRTYSASSSENSGNPNELGPGLAFDGNPETRWSSVFRDVKDCFIEVDFGESIECNAVAVNECKIWAHVTGFRIDINENGSWKTVYTGEMIQNDRKMFFGKVTTDKLRLVFDSATGNAEEYLTVTLYEVSVYYDEKGSENGLGESGWTMLPFKSGTTGITADYLYCVGGYHSIDNGCPAWGTSVYADSRFIGDEMGVLNIEYEDGTKDEIPLVFGYTMWFKNNFMDGGATFKTEEATDDLVKTLDEALYLSGAYESKDFCVLKVKIKNKGIKTIDIKDNKTKNGYPVFYGAYLTKDEGTVLKGGETDVDTSDKFFKTHTVDSSNPYPDKVKKALEKINNALLTYESEYEGYKGYEYPKDYKGVKITFKGNDLAEISTGVIYENLMNLVNRVDNNGMMHTSYKDAPSWRYDGFGTWVPKANSYYDCFYSRDGARAIMSLNGYGYEDKGEKSSLYANKAMMYYRENNLKIRGVQIPGHFSVIINKPLIYSKVLTNVGWGTKFTRERFGDDYQNMGNQETDGHGLMMLANWNVWKNKGSKKEWVETNWTELKETADFILWSFENKDISFAQNGLLYAESEAGMQQYTLYCNVPCCLGLFCYGEMAEVMGKTEESEEWKKCANTMLEAITKRLSSKEKWDLTKSGFFHDPVITMLADVYGYDIDDMPEEWVTKSKNTYEDDIKRIRENGYYGASGIGYNHSMITQNALLLDQMADAGKLIENLTRLSYAPGLPQPYLVPEGITVDFENGIIRRQGDLGNLVQLAEALKCYNIVAGISTVREGVIKIMPRLPLDWDMDIQNYELQNAEGTLDIKFGYPKNGVQTSQIAFKDLSGADKAEVRMGPFPMDTKNIKAKVDGKETECMLTESGDSKWAWVTLKPGKKNIVNVIYSSDDTLPEWPVEQVSKTHIPLIGYISLLTLGVIGIGYFIYRKKK